MIEIKKLNRELNHLKAMIKKEYLVFIRYPIAVFASFATPVFLVLIFSFTALSFLANPKQQEVQQMVTFMYIGILGYIYLEVSNAASSGIRDEQHQGTLEALFLTPATKITNVIARVALRFIVLSLNTIIIYIAISLTLEPVKLHNLILGFYFFLLLILQFLSLGFIVSALTLKLKETAVVLSNLLVFFVMIFSSFFFTFSTFPEGVLYYIPRIIPMSYTVDAMRTAFLDFPSGFPELITFQIEFLIATITTVAMLSFSIWFYLKMEKQIRKDATMTEY